MEFKMINETKDWNMIPHVVADASISNTSFLDVSKELKEMGIKNHRFTLTLVNKDLINLDIRSNTLTADQLNAIEKECEINPWYFFREVMLVAAPGGHQPLEAIVQKVLALWSGVVNRTTSISGGRQSGVTSTKRAILMDHAKALAIEEMVFFKGFGAGTIASKLDHSVIVAGDIGYVPNFHHVLDMWFDNDCGDCPKLVIGGNLDDTMTYNKNLLDVCRVLTPQDLDNGPTTYAPALIRLL